MRIIIHCNNEHKLDAIEKDIQNQYAHIVSPDKTRYYYLLLYKGKHYNHIEIIRGIVADGIRKSDRKTHQEVF